jgi:Fur family ferric uptake transcriptional regulator
MAKDSLIQDLKERGVRITPQRAIIVETVEALSGHVTADDVFRQVQKVNSYISLATVYRTLDLLKDLGIITESNLGTGTTHYALRTHGTHHHAVCRISKETLDLPPDFFEGVIKRLKDEYNFIVDNNHIVLFGWLEEHYPGPPKNSVE